MKARKDNCLRHLRNSSSNSLINTNSDDSSQVKLTKNSANNIKKSENSFEYYFKTNYAWQSVFIPENVENSIQEVRF